MLKLQATCDLPLLKEDGDSIVLFRPHVPEGALAEIADTLASRWIGQGPKVEAFERSFTEHLAIRYPAVAVGSGTDALHLAYLLAGVKAGDEVITTVFTCTATNIPLLYLDAEIRFADIQPHSLNIDPADVRRLLTKKTRAIVCVHYGGLPCDMSELRTIADEAGIPLIADAAHALGARYRGAPVGGGADFTVFSFQAVKTLTTGDGGALVIKDLRLVEKAKRLRWFGIDRSAKQGGYWDNDIREVGFKYQMTDIAAAMGLAGLRELDAVLAYRRRLLQEYESGLHGIDGLRFVGGGFLDRTHAAWLCTVIVQRRADLQRILREHRIESGQIHYRNDRYSIFSRFRRRAMPVMDELEDNYLILPLHTHMRIEDVRRVCRVIAGGW
jgi:perosamine synthetase